MSDISKADWKLFRERLPEWQETYMERMIQKYIKLLQGEENASDKFWKLEKRIQKDKKKPGVILELDKSETPWNLVALLKDKVITPADLEGFSDDMKEIVLRLYNH